MKNLLLLAAFVSLVVAACSSVPREPSHGAAAPAECCASGEAKAPIQKAQSPVGSVQTENRPLEPKKVDAAAAVSSGPIHLIPGGVIKYVELGERDSYRVHLKGGHTYRVELNKSHGGRQNFKVFSEDGEVLLNKDAKSDKMQNYIMRVPAGTDYVEVRAYHDQGVLNSRGGSDGNKGAYPDAKGCLFASMAWDPPHANLNIYPAP